MKLQTTLPEKTILVPVLAALNLFILMFFVMLTGNQLSVNHTGSMVDLPPSNFELDQYANQLVISLQRMNERSMIYLGKKASNLEEIEQELQKLKEQDKQLDTLVLIQSDGLVLIKDEREIVELVQKAGFKIGLVGGNKQSNHEQSKLK